MKCKECGTDFRARQYNSEFCCTKHRGDYNNRRALRGATLYDIEMLIRHEPDTADKHDLAAVKENLLEAWRKEDEEKRASRKSWKRAFDVVADTLRFRGER